MNARQPALRDFLHLTGLGLRARTGAMPAAAPVIDAILTRLERVEPSSSRDAPDRLTIDQWLAPALAEARRAGGMAETLANAFARTEPDLAWRRRRGSEMQRDRFADHHANATIVGPGGLEARDDVWVGVSVMAPQTRYPDHAHPPEEVYLSLSDGEWRQGQEPWHRPGIGGLVHNPPNVLHAMRSGPRPLLAIWCLLLA